MILMMKIQFLSVLFLLLCYVYIYYNYVVVNISYAITPSHIIIHLLHNLNCDYRTKKQTSYTLTFLILYFIVYSMDYLSYFFILLIFTLLVFMIFSL